MQRADDYHELRKTLVSIDYVVIRNTDIIL